MSLLPLDPASAWLAPLAGWSDLPFRLLCRRLGAAVCCTEMVSAKGLVYGGKNTEELLDTCPEDNPLVVQIFGAEPEFMARAVHILKDRGFTHFDVNMGCSVPKVTKTGSGAALLKTPELALAVADAVIRASGEGMAGFKLRLDWEPGCGGRQNDICYELAPRLAAMGAGWITLHPRYARQGFSGQTDHAATVRLAEELTVPVIASGDLFQAEDARILLRNSSIAAVMYARGALNNPALFAQHRRLLAPEGAPVSLPGFSEGNDGRSNLLAVIRCHAELARTLSPRTALLKMRTIVPRYVKGLDGAKALRQKLIACTDWKTLDHILEEEFGRSV